NARYAARMAVGEQLQIEGRLQSRGYQKQLTDGTVLEKTAYEVSVGRLEQLRLEERPDVLAQHEAGPV
nr:single-stranded DNA-binding protein [Clostridia bacterium]